MPHYMFYWYDGRENERFLAKIEAKAEVVKRLLEEYRASDPTGYNDYDFIEFLKSKGISAEIIEPDEWIYF
jgi:hypothetical protein